MLNYLKLIRVKHWIKNLLIFLPLLFSREINSVNILLTILGFFSFSFASSVVYIINDIKDVEKDKIHPVKKNRPIASGVISINNALLILLILLIVSFVILFYLSLYNYFISIYIIIYIVLNILYSIRCYDTCFRFFN